MKVVIVGAGLIGLTTAYFLRRQGHAVTVIERREGAGLETSFANGTLLTPSQPEPWNSPGCWRVLLGSLGRPDAPLQLRLRTLPGLTRWGITFLRNSASGHFQRNTVANLRLALDSLSVMASIRRDLEIEYDRTSRGILKLFRQAQSMDATLTAAERLRADGLRFRALSRAETAALEPALAPIADQLAGAVHYLADETGNAYRFCTALAGRLAAQGTEIAFNSPVSRFVAKGRRVVALETPHERYVADHFVVAAGSYSAGLVRPLGLRVPVQPAKGYSVTFDSAVGTALRTPLVDDEMHTVVVPIGTSIRVAGTAEFAGFDLSLRPERTGTLIRLAQGLLPQAGLDVKGARAWCGLRPMSADGVPLIGKTSFENLWVNTGHGHLGWTLAAGSGQLLAQLLCERVPAMDTAPYDPRRFGSL